MQKITTCLIPFYNEGNRVLYTLEELTKIVEFEEIICVDDGSTDDGSRLISEKYPQVKIVTLKKNEGKAAAIFEGARHVKTKYTLMFDADLNNIKVSEIETAIQKISSNQKIDMIILRRVVESKFLSLIRHDIVMSGQRILKTADLDNIAKLNPKKYQIEMAINDFMMKNKKIVFWMPITTTNPAKIDKFGILKSFTLYRDAMAGYFTYAGLGGYLNQVLFFCRKSI